jgi:hypothetical protein
MDRQSESFSRIFSSVTGLDKSFMLIRKTRTSSSINENSEIFNKGLGAVRAKIGPTSDVDKIFSKMYSQYVLFRNTYS